MGHHLPFFTCLKSEWQEKVSAHKNRPAGGPLQNTQSRRDQFTLLKITPASMSLIKFSLRQQLHPPAPYHPTIFQLPPRALWHQQVLFVTEPAAHAPRLQNSSRRAPSLVLQCLLFCFTLYSLGWMPFLFSRVKSSLWNMALWNINFMSHKRNALKHTFNCVFILSNDSLINLS